MWGDVNGPMKHKGFFILEGKAKEYFHNLILGKPPLKKKKESNQQI